MKHHGIIAGIKFVILWIRSLYWMHVAFSRSRDNAHEFRDFPMYALRILRMTRKHPDPTKRHIGAHADWEYRKRKKNILYDRKNDM